MNNHVHLVIDDPHDHMSMALHRVTSSYATYFNHVFGHTGHVFEGRYGSVPIRDDKQLLAAVRYVHDNPLKGMGISPDLYPWCSYPEYASGTSTYADIDNLLDLLGGMSVKHVQRLTGIGEWAIRKAAGRIKPRSSERDPR